MRTKAEEKKRMKGDVRGGLQRDNCKRERVEKNDGYNPD